MNNTKIAIVGSRGIPAKYGGWETLAEELSTRLAKTGRFKVYVTCESNKFGEDIYSGVIRTHFPKINTKSLTIPGIRDLIPITYLLLRHNHIDIFYILGPSSILAILLVKINRKKVISNPDGIEWKRTIKRKSWAPFYLKPIFILTTILLWVMERFPTKLSDIVIADAYKIKEHLIQHHNIEEKRIKVIPYGARKLISSKFSKDVEIKVLQKFGLEPNEYYLTVARIVAENNIHLEVEGFKKANSGKKLVIVGNFNEKDPYTKHLIRLNGGDENIVFLDPIYDREVLGVLRKNCFAYIHAYEVGGTNPSLLEQMLFKRPILAYDVPFNREVLEEGGIYFKDADDLSNKMRMLERGEFDLRLIKKTQVKRIKRQYNWEKVAREYERVFNWILEGTP